VVRVLHERDGLVGRRIVRKKKHGRGSMRAKKKSRRNRCDRNTEIYAETETSFEVSGAPLATAAKDTGSL